MASRRKFVTPSSLGRPLPPGFVQCHACGEFNGTTDAKNLTNHLDKAGQISVTCLCHGIPCPSCNTRLIHRPISNTYYPATNRIEHWPYFAGLANCDECRLNARNEKHLE